MFDVDDPKAAEIAEVIANSSCRKILGLLAEEELSESEIASKMRIPINTVGYNVKKLVKAGFIESTGKTLWSVKGKKVLRYRVSEKKIVISSKRKIGGVLPSILASAVAVLGTKIFYGPGGFSKMSRDYIGESATAPVAAAEAFAAEGTDYALPVAEAASSVGSEGALLLALVGLVTFMITMVVWNWRKIW